MALNNISDNDYYTYAWAGKHLLWMGLKKLADYSFERALQLRENTFLHMHFIGSCYFLAGFLEEALPLFSQAIGIREYEKCLLAMYFFCQFPEQIRSQNMKLNVRDFEVIFQRSHNFYNYLSPTNDSINSEFSPYKAVGFSDILPLKNTHNS